MTQSVTRLKELLFDTETSADSLSGFERRFVEASQRLQALEELSSAEKRERLEMLRRLEQLFDRAGTQDRFVKSVSDVLDAALRDAEVARHDEMSRALAPLVVNTVRSELRGSQDEMVQVLYPLTGRMVKAYVATAIKDLSEEINRRLEQNPLTLKLRSLTTGIPVSDLAIASSQRLKVEEVYLIRRGSGALLARWPETRDVLSNSDIHLSGVLSAINDFASHAFADDGGNLRTFKLDDFTVYLRASPVYLLAAKCRGVAPSGAEAVFDDAFLALLDDLNALPPPSGGQSTAAAPPAVLAPLASSVETRTTEIYDRNDRAGLWFNPLKVLFFLIAVPLLTGLIWWGYTSFEASRTRDIARDVIRGMPALTGYKTDVQVGYRGRSITIGGLLPTESVRSELIARLGEALPNTAVTSELGVLPVAETIDPTPRIEALRREMSVVEAQMLRRQLGRILDQTSRRIALVLPELEALERLAKTREHKAQVRQAIVDARRVEREIGTRRAIFAETRDSASLAALSALVAPVNRLSGRLRGATDAVSGLLDDGATPASGGTPARTASAPTDASGAIEALSAESEKLAAMTLAVTKAVQQASLIRIPAPPPPVVSSRPLTPREKLAAFVGEHAVFFANGTDFYDTVAAKRVLDDLAQLMRGNSVLVRVIGYTDETGGRDRNNPLGESRAEAVVAELVRRGIPTARLVAVGRADGLSLSPEKGAQSPNRRVEFELGFVGEARR